MGTHVARVTLVARRGGAHAVVGWLEERAVVVEEGAHVQNIVATVGAKPGAQPLVDRLGVADVAKHGLERHARLAQCLRGRHERCLVEVDAHHQ